jgi:hypothetical protein
MLNEIEVEQLRRSIARCLTVATVVVAILGSHQNAVASPKHTISFVNRCKQQIWLAAYGTDDVTPSNWALAPTCTTANQQTVCPSHVCDTGACTCQTDAECTFGSSADTTASCDLTTNRCVKATTIDIEPGWSGRFWPRTGCSGTDTSFLCETGQCGAGGGNIDCSVQNETADVATLFELASADVDGADNFDVSLVSGYNIPIAVKVRLPENTHRWEPNTSFASGYQIIEKVGKDTFVFTRAGANAPTGSTRPAFPAVWTETVADANGVTWANTGPACQTSGCRAPIREAKCPAELRVTTTGGQYIGCNAPANSCAESGAECAAHLDYYQCQNNAGTTDLFGKTLTLTSANAGTFTCFSPNDCPPGTTCDMDPAFEGGFKLPRGGGVCTPVAQNGGCDTANDGDACPDVDYPFMDYTCRKLANVQVNAQVCVPPVKRGLGDLWWNAANWTHDDPSPTPTPSVTPSGTPGPTPTPSACTQDTDCTGQQKCLTDPVHGGQQQCPPNGSCTCWNPKTCTAATCPGANQCLNSAGIPDGTGGVDCATDTCYCGPQGIYSGSCGPTNPKWLHANRKLGGDGARWPTSFKNQCPAAYSYQFDDPSSNWTCPNFGGLNDYRVVFCGAVSTSE